MKRKNREVMDAFKILKSIGGIATTGQIRKEAEEYGLKFDIKHSLKRLQELGYVKSERPSVPDNLMLRWEITKDYIANS